MKRIPILATVLLLAACKEKPAVVQNPAAPSAALSQVLAAAPAGEPQAIHLARSTAKPGDGITLGGRIMGNAKPFVDGRAAFILGDPAVLTPCNEKPGDSCSTPWDTCCNSPEEKRTGTATIQIVGEDGKVLRESLEGVGGLTKLATVTITGTVAETSSADALVVDAKAIRVD